MAFLGSKSFDLSSPKTPSCLTWLTVIAQRPFLASDGPDTTASIGSTTTAPRTLDPCTSETTLRDNTWQPTASDNSEKLILRSAGVQKVITDCITQLTMNANTHTTQTKTKKEMPKPEDPLYKTALCKNFEKHGKCKYGKRCTFAHGKDELRNRPLRATRPQRSLSEPTLNVYLEAATQPTAKVGKEASVFEYHTEEFLTLPLEDKPRKRPLCRAQQRSLSEPTLNEYLEAARQPTAKVAKKVHVFEYRMNSTAPAFVPQTPMNPMNPLAPEFQPEGMLVAIECAEMVLSES